MAIRPYKPSNKADPQARWISDYYDGSKNPRTGKPRRRWHLCASREAARTHQAEQTVRKAKAPKLSARVDSEIRLRDLIERWLPGIKADLERATFEMYSWGARHIKGAAVADFKVRDITKQDCRDFIRYVASEPLARGRRQLSKHSTKIVFSVFNLVLGEAVELEIRADNPMTGAVRRARKTKVLSPTHETKRVKALTREQLHISLESCRTRYASRFPLYFLMSRTGLRPGEAAGLKFTDINLAIRKIRIERSWSKHRTVNDTKTHRARFVDISDTLCAFLETYIADMTRFWALKGKPLPEWVFHNPLTGDPWDRNRSRKYFKVALTRVGFGDHTLYDLRHSYASILLSSGVNIKYVQEQMGHSDIRLTVHLYGSWIPTSNPAALNVLEPPPGLVGLPVENQIRVH